MSSKSSTFAVAVMMCVSSSAFALPSVMPVSMMEIMAKIAAMPNPREMQVKDISSMSHWMIPTMMAPEGVGAPFMAEGHKFILPEFAVSQYAPVYKMGDEPFQNSPVIPNFASGAR